MVYERKVCLIRTPRLTYCTVLKQSHCDICRLACNVGVDEAGRGPVLGPMVYGIAASPVEKHDDLVALGMWLLSVRERLQMSSRCLGVADSKALTDEVRSAIVARMNDAEDSASHTVAYALRVLTPAHLSRASLVD